MTKQQGTRQQISSGTISFKATLYTISSWTIIRLPKDASKKLPSRGQVMVEGLLNGKQFQTPLEPDGNWSHWFRIDKKLQNTAHVSAGDTVAVTVKIMKAWPEPDIPVDWQRALNEHPQALDLWRHITPMARWEWIRWSRATNNTETRKKRIEVGCSKLKSGEKRPCCWNRNLCTEPAVSKNGVLLGL